MSSHFVQNVKKGWQGSCSWRGGCGTDTDGLPRQAWDSRQRCLLDLENSKLKLFKLNFALSSKILIFHFNSMTKFRNLIQNVNFNTFLERFVCKFHTKINRFREISSKVVLSPLRKIMKQKLALGCLTSPYATHPNPNLNRNRNPRPTTSHISALSPFPKRKKRSSCILWHPLRSSPTRRNVKSSQIKVKQFTPSAPEMALMGMNW